MPRLLNLSLLVALMMSLAGSALAAHGVLHSDFSLYTDDWTSNPTVYQPTLIQATGEARLDTMVGLDYGRFEWRSVVPMGAAEVQDLSVALQLSVLEADSVDLWMSWIDGSTELGTAQVLDVTRGTNVASGPIVASLAGITAPESMTGFKLMVYVRGGSATFDDVSIVSTATSVVPEPGTAVLMGLGLGWLASRRDHRNAA
jgi:hypothetical protein